MKTVVTLFSGCAMLAAAAGALAQHHGHAGDNRGGNGGFSANGGYAGNGGYRGNGGNGGYGAHSGGRGGSPGYVQPSHRGDGRYQGSGRGWNGGHGYAPRAHGGYGGYGSHGGYRPYGGYRSYSYGTPYYVAPPVLGYYGPTYYDYSYYEPPTYVAQPYVVTQPVVIAQTRPAAPPPPPPQPEYVPAPVAQAASAPQPAPRRPAPRFDRVTLSAQELFDFDKSALKSPQPKLDEIAWALRENPQISSVHITGYTDRLGSTSYNQKLSQKRAEAVRDYLVIKGVESKRLIAIGRGESDPVVNCPDMKRADLIKCLEPNRRVEVEQITIERSL